MLRLFKSVFLIASVISFCFHFANVQAQDKPNILWLVIEDTSPQFIGCYGDKNAKTPNIDRLAREGVRFTNAFSTGTVCSPSRSTIITGVRTFEMGTGNHRSQYPIPDFIKGFPYYFKQAGFYTSNNYKTDYNTSDAKRLIQESWNESSDKAGWWNRKNGQPFFSVFNFNDSHQSRVMTNPYDLYKKQVLDSLPKALQTGDDDFIVPPVFKDTPAMRHQLARIYNGISLADYNIGKILDRLKKDNLLNNTIIFFYADHGEAMPKGKTNGIDMGHRVPFIVWFPEAWKNLSPKGTGGTISDELIDFADLAPTLLKLYGASVPAYMHGRNFLGKSPLPEPKNIILSSDGSEGAANLMRTITNGNLSYSKAFMPFMSQMFYQKYFDFATILQQMRKDFKNKALSDVQQQLFEMGNAEYLYNYKNDPWQYKNLSCDREYKKIVRQMRMDLKDSIIKNKDIMFLPEYEIARISKIGTAYQYRVNKDEYPIKKIYEAAALSGLQTKTAIKKQLDFLHHKNSYVRYWAAIGLKSRGKELLNYKKEILSGIDDVYLPVKIVLASVCYDHFGSNKAKNILINSIVLKDEIQLNLLTIQMLMYQKNKQEFIPEIRKLLEQKNIRAEVREAAELFLYQTTGTPLIYKSYW